MSIDSDMMSKAMTAEEIKEAISLLHPGDRAIITFARLAEIFALQALASLSEKQQIRIDNGYVAVGDHQQRKVLIRPGFCWASFRDALNPNTILRIDVP